MIVYTFFYTGNVSIGSLTSPISSPGHLKESPFLLNEVRALRTALNNERNKNAKLETDYYTKIFQKLKPLPVSNSYYFFTFYCNINW